MPERVSVFAFFGSNIDVLFTTTVSTFLSPLEKSNICRLRMKFILIENDIRKGNSLSSTHIPAIRLQHIFPPLKRGEGGCAGFMIKRSRTGFPTEAGDENLVNCKRDFIAHCFPLSPFRRPDETKII